MTTRRTLLSSLPGIALAQMMRSEAQAAPHFAPKAKRVLHISCPGGASHVDLWDHKPMLEKMDGKPLPGAENEVTFEGKNGPLLKSPWDFVPAGKSGKMITSLFPHLHRHVDDMAFIHSMTSKTNTHGPGCVYISTCFVREGFPSAGAWVSHALGSMNDNLPTFIAINDIRGEPPNGKANWGNGFLPAQHQGIVMSAHQQVRNMSRPTQISAAQDRATFDFLRASNEEHMQRLGGDSDLQARINAYELAAKMQLAAPEVRDLSKEPAHIQKLYGTEDANPLKAAYAKNCLLARRFLERDVRYVSLFCSSRASAVNGLLNWDAHNFLKADYDRHAPIFDQPTAALLTDLKQRGLLEDTLVLWTTEFGRMPTLQGGTAGRDHNPDAFTCWMMGAGIKGGTSYGATDEFGRRSVQEVSSVYDFYATVLHLLGLDHERLTYYFNGTNRRLTDVHGHVIRPILA
jgi:hypothetical protein